MKILIQIAVLFIVSQPVFAQHTHDHSGHSSVDKISLKLNDGKKWPTDRALRSNMLGIHDLIKNKLKKIHDYSMTSEEYKSLASRIHENINSIFKNCKLPPKADAQLHIIMSGMMNANNVIKAETNSKKRHEAVKKVLGHYQAYIKYFDTEMKDASSK